MSSTTFYQPLERSRWFEDYDSVLSTSKQQDEILQMVIDWSDWLASGETVSSVAYEDHGVTTSSKSNTTTTSTCNVTGLGETEITVTLSTGRTFKRKRRFYSIDGVRATDYR